MSHFSVLVITPEIPTDEALAAILQPWHEFECTGIDDQYVVEVDKTEEAIKAYNEATVIRLKGPDGTLHDRFTEAGEWRPEFSEPDPGIPSRRREFIPAGFEKIEIPASEVESAADWIAEYYGWPIAGKGLGDDAKYGFIEINGDGDVVRCIDRTNPNKKWDWWVIGGRWSGLLKMKADTPIRRGRPGVLGSQLNGDASHGDQALLANIDLDGMRDRARAEYGERWDKVMKAAGALDRPKSWADILGASSNIDVARKLYRDQPAVAALEAAFPDSWGLEAELRALSMEREAYVAEGAAGVLSTFAVVKDGQWFERGKMGWFACVSDEKPEGEWDREFAALLDGLPGTTALTLVDCHI